MDNADSAIISPMYKVFELKPGVKILPEFIYQMIKSDSVLSRFRDSGNGSIKRRKSVSFLSFESIDIVLPPLDEQQKIASIYQSIRTLEESLTNERLKVVAATASIFDRIK